MLRGHVAARSILVTLTVVVSIAYAYSEWTNAGWWVPTSHWQIPRAWASYHPLLFHACFGLLLGIGWLTVVRFIGYYVLIVECTLLGNPALAAVAMSIFGAFRGLPVFVTALVLPQRTVFRLHAADRWFARFDNNLRYGRALLLISAAYALPFTIGSVFEG